MTATTTLADSLAQVIADPERVKRRPIDLAAHANDASHYLLHPQAVVLPADAAEVAQLLQLGVRDRLNLTFRSGGTSLSGQGVTDGVLVDTRRFFRGLEVLDDGRAVRLQPGLTVNEVNARLAPYGRKIGPDPASSAACTIGGVVANNSSGMSCGTEFNTYSTLRSMTFVLASGTVIDTGKPDADDELRHRERDLYEGLARLTRRVRDDAHSVERLRHLFSMKNTMGYGLNSFLDFERPIDVLAHLLVGSEGTLGFVADVVLETLPILPHAATSMLVFANTSDATDALPALLDAGAKTLELLDARALVVAQSDPRAPSTVKELDVQSHAGLLVEFQTATADELDGIQADAEPVLAQLPLTRDAGLTREPAARASLWALRKGLYTAVAAARPSGTTALLEDISVPVRTLPSTCDGLTELFDRHGYEGSVIFGHAKDGNVHFLVNERFDDPRELERYRVFTDEMVDLVLAQDGTLKAEHGTGRIMTPFVRRQYGDELYGVMQELKRLCDPTGLLNPGIILSDKADAHLTDLKTVPTVDPEVDACVECGYCEPVCPSRRVTTTPRQRIVLRRAAAKDPALAAEIEADYAYDAVDTCAADGMCATACPVRINTGDLMKRLRSERHSDRAQQAGKAVALRWQGVSGTARVALRAASAVPGLASAASAAARKVLPTDLVPLYSRAVPSGGDHRPEPVYPANPDVVFFPTCLHQVFAPEQGDGSAHAFLRLAERAGVVVAVPEGIGSMCCGVPWESKGFTEGSRAMAARVVDGLWSSTQQGRLPVVVDASSCTHGLEGLGKLLPDDGRVASLRFVDAVSFTAHEILPKLAVGTKASSLTLHPTCSTTHLGIGDDLRLLAEAVADEVVVPKAWGCCGYAGDRGMLHPELTEAATAEQAAEVRAHPTELYASCNRTCEIGVSQATGATYRHVLEILDDVASPGEQKLSL
ncbi:FAD-binding and (Fe-S)-binding domain-containing protein [Actinomycetospora termitidis]|uniref:D-lactate dehydrogenase (cytochrome) n=1 Tax=Actinomycetospora termitidis TaxID=3053470 RepID=A0ABT7M526_9PSEU|nr:FAD-binding and (Fe-S)-binding domain-containing protein [Actinomycetospora sp. Odt1-22]MDL5155750.1 FAD-binding and (Fe-S)-binding domain-containing protein [Actinomycetospora sp. Odt1-22]